VTARGEMGRPVKYRFGVGRLGLSLTDRNGRTWLVVDGEERRGVIGVVNDEQGRWGLSKTVWAELGCR
jgi:hypothetical protein